MRRRAAVTVFLSACLLHLTAAGCTVGPVGQHHRIGTLEIGADLPLSGDDLVDGVPVRNAISLAISEAGWVCGAASHTDACVSLQTRFTDDVSKGIHDPATGAANVRQLLADHRVIGMIGPLYDGVARSELPIANAASLAVIGPATATDVCLTQEPPDGHCEGLAARLRPNGGNNFFRVVATSLSEGAGAAELAYRNLGRRHAFLVSDSSWLGQRLAAGFASRFSQLGGTIVSEQALADVVYFPGSNLPAAALIRRQIPSTAPDVPLIGSDALGSDQFAKAAGIAARGSYYTMVGPDPAALKSAAGFRRAYRSRYGDGPTTSALAAFDATGVLLAAIGRAIDDAGGSLPSRGQVLADVARTTSYAGAMGSFGFDAAGDTTLRWVSSYQWLASTDAKGQYTGEFAVP